jgi:hypothetical protein
LNGRVDAVHLRASRDGGHSEARCRARQRRSAKGGTRTPIAFQLPDPKSGASASSATFARAVDSVTRDAKTRVDALRRPDPYATIRAPDDPSGPRPQRSNRSVSWTVSGARRRRRSPARLAAPVDTGQHPLSDDRARAPRGDDRRGRGRDLSVVLVARPRRVRVVRRRPADGVRLPAVPSVGLAAERVTCADAADSHDTTLQAARDRQKSTC